jgi:hypothetical protein
LDDDSNKQYIIHIPILLDCYIAIYLLFGGTAKLPDLLQGNPSKEGEAADDDEEVQADGPSQDGASGDNPASSITEFLI